MPAESCVVDFYTLASRADRTQKLTRHGVWDTADTSAVRPTDVLATLVHIADDDHDRPGGRHSGADESPAAGCDFRLDDPCGKLQEKS